MAIPLAKKANFPHTKVMLDSKKLLYIFSDVAYVTELLPAKKSGDFALHNFRQINGEYLNNDVFIEENIAKLFAKLEKEEYVLVLPDFFFTNTIVEVGEKAKTKIDKQITEELLPSLDLTDKTHQIQHFVLTQYGEKSNVQLSAIERSLLAPIYESALANGVKISKIVSLSWTIKALISLEPSLSLVQMGENLYLVQHYIGVDQATTSEVTDVEKIAETVKTLRGAEPSIQTMYLLTNELVGKKLDELLNKTLPTQQLTSFADENPEVPPYVRQIIEAGAKTLSVTDFNVPAFSLEKVDQELIDQAKVVQVLVDSKNEEVEDGDTLPEPTSLQKDDTKKVTADKEDLKPKEITPVDEVMQTKELEPTKSEPKINLPETMASDVLEEKSESLVESSKTGDILENMEDDKLYPPKDQKNTTPMTDEKVDDALSRFAVQDSSLENVEKTMIEPKTAEPILNKNDKPVIKNKTGVSSMLKMIFVSIAVFFLTVGVGVGLGISYLSVSQQGSNEASPSPVALVSPSPEASLTPSPVATSSASVNLDEVTILVVNATSKAGYASTVKKLLTDADFVNVDAGNAKGDYKAGNYLLMTEENSQLLKMVEEATDLTLTYSSEIKTEDLKGSYDAVLVLNE